MRKILYDEWIHKKFSVKKTYFKCLCSFLLLLGKDISVFSDEASVYEEAPKEEGVPGAQEAPGTVSGEWGGSRTYLQGKGLQLQGTLTLDDTWNLGGGKSVSPYYGDAEYLLDLNLTLLSDPLFRYKGGTFFIDYQGHHGRNPTERSVGSFVAVDVIEAPSFDELYALWYKQQFTFGEYGFWFQVGKNDAYNTFTTTTHTGPFINAGYTALPTILFFPTYAEPAMAVIVSGSFPYNISLTAAVYDGSLASGFRTGKAGVIGHFFSDLPDHAFLIGELDFAWGNDYQGRLGIGAWKHTAKFTKFNEKTQKGTSGPYVTLDQIIYARNGEVGAFFFLYGWADPSISPANQYFGTGLTWNGAVYARPNDVFGIGLSSVNFTNDPDAGFTESYETSYEVFYKWQFARSTFLEPDFQYIVHPGGQGLSNAWVFTLRLQLSL